MKEKVYRTRIKVCRMCPDSGYTCGRKENVSVILHYDCCSPKFEKSRIVDDPWGDFPEWCPLEDFNPKEQGDQP